MLRVAALALLFVLGSAAGARAIEQQTGPIYVIIPFGEPGDSDPVLKRATRQLALDLTDKRIRTAVAMPMDQIEAVGTARALCGSYSADGLIVPSLRFEQSKERNLTGFLPVVGGVVSSSGVFDRSPIRASLRLYLVDCTGVVRSKTFTTANKVHKGQNVQAGLTEIANEAMSEAVDEFADRPPAPGSSPEPAPSPVPAGR